ncbi:MAG: nuclear transport factor 2 family protein [bacterium]|nr:nuclear transport factor 2 family protein [bacterium]
MKNLLFTLIILLFSGSVYAQDMDHDHDAMMKENAVKKVLKAYKNALEALDLSDTQKLFTEDADIFENGKYEGSYQDYLDHHIGPELAHFKEFSFSDYKVDVQIDGNIAIAFETYNYKIVTSGGESRTIERQAVATSVLKNTESGWKIIQNHGSSRTVRN